MNAIDLKTKYLISFAIWLSPILIIMILVFFIISEAIYFQNRINIEPIENELIEAVRKEEELIQEIERKSAKAALLDSIRIMLLESKGNLEAISLRMYSKSEMAEGMVDIARIISYSGLKLEQMKPGTEQKNNYYAEFPLKLRIVGSYDGLNRFMSELAYFPRIITVDDFTIYYSAKKEGNLQIILNLKIYGYL